MVRPFPVISVSFLAVLIGLWSVDVVFVLSNVIAFLAEKLALIAKIPDFIKITRDGAAPEYFGYIKWAVIILSLLWLAIRERWLAPARWAIVFVIILIDDSIQIHETVGLMLTEHLTLPVSLQAQTQDIAELLVFGTMGLIALALTASMFFSRDHYTRAISKRLGLVILFLVFFGVFLDFLHQTITNFSTGTFAAPFLPQIFAMLEDGGEMFVASYAAAFILTLPGLEPLSAGGMSARTDIV
jgi:hypothetical protein